LFKLKVVCAVTGTGVSLIAVGTAYDSVLVESGRDPVFLPFLGKTYSSVLVEGPNKKYQDYTGKFAPSETEISKNKESVTEVLKKYHKMSP
jgi:hypothetical protein